MSAADVEEWGELVRGLRAYAELLNASGAFGVPGLGTNVVAPIPAATDLGVERGAEAVGVLSADGSRAGSAAGHAFGDAGPEPAPPDWATRHARLAVLAETVAGCRKCGLHAGRQQTVFARGTGTSGLCFVGEGPGADEDAEGLPFVGVAGQLLDRMIAAMGFSQDEVYVCNIVKCRPPKNRKPEPDEMAACIPFLHEQLELVAPQVIVALGATAVQGLLGTTSGIVRLRGNWRLYRGRIAVMPTFHPAYLLRTPSAKRDVWQDLRAVVQHMGRALPQKPDRADPTE